VARKARIPWNGRASGGFAHARAPMILHMAKRKRVDSVTRPYRSPTGSQQATTPGVALHPGNISSLPCSQPNYRSARVPPEPRDPMAPSPATRW
jgi:hypothetical protein